MNSKIYLIVDNHSKDTVYLHPITAERMKIEEGTGTLKFGTQASTINIIITAKYKENELYISENVLKHLKIPLFCEFEFINDQQNLMIGPFIGILASLSKKELEGNLNNFSDYVYHYDQIGGAIIVFSLDEVTPEEQTIQGFMFNPTNKEWEKGIYLYPSSLFLRIKWFGPKWQQHFESFMGNKIFNNFYFDKWSIHKHLMNSPDLTDYVPKTVLYTKPSDLLSFLKGNSSAYLKPINSSRGNGIIKIDRLGKNRALVKYFGRSKVTQKNLNNQKEMNRFFRQRLIPGKYIVQKSLDLVTKNAGIIDFRIYLTKDSTKEWKYITTFSKEGMPGEIVSNINRGGVAGRGLQLLKETLFLTDQEVNEIEHTMQTAAIKAVKALEKSGVHFANTGVDIGVDITKKVWIIEIQFNSPGQKGFLLDKTLYHEYLKTIMLYSKSLAEF
ncbi:YheC/YheD family protein [Paenibacillus sp. N4]|uniref:YheC/YheD family endospore coat-associated protein n=1 Tax=Paenibacillus vietnamensis TaxID=2590547 RepID=UPI001CD0F799|nr:YheC/YheD family protein [Paenibacillus vietnamensis]MCA0757191.1 YheC/YheD family protein [Paenibacillus vietnamensis]